MISIFDKLICCNFDLTNLITLKYYIVKIELRKMSFDCFIIAPSSKVVVIKSTNCTSGVSKFI